MSILGIDYGDRHIGLAISSEHLIAESLRVIPRKNANNAIATICKEQNVRTIVIGLPEGTIAGRIHRFGKALKKHLAAAVVYWDETLTTKHALQVLITAGTRQKKRREKEHAVAAMLILQDYLNEHKK